MKKIFATVLSAFCILSVIVFTACGGNEEQENSGGDLEKIENIIKGEQAWNDAFENIEYVNFSMRVKIVFNDMEMINIVKISESAVYYENNNGGPKFYSVKNTDGTYTTYIEKEAYSESNSTNVEKYFKVSEDTSDRYFMSARTETVFKVSYADYFNLFTFDSESGKYKYAGDLETTAYQFNGSELGKILCFNNELKVVNNKIVYIKSEYKPKNEDEFEDYDETKSYLFEYYNIGSTVVTVPEEVINSAVK